MTPSPKPTVVITGATGLLGRTVLKAFQESEKYEVIGTGWTRAKEPIQALNLLSATEVDQALTRWKPRVLIHCAAEKRPDKAQEDPEAAEALNVQATGHLARICAEQGVFLVYISTDYVFDGEDPPYMPEDGTNPLNFYGRTKRAGEIQVLETEGSSVCLRVPILYGEAMDPAESAVNILADRVAHRKPGIDLEMDDVAVRFPTNTADVARALLAMTHQTLAGQTLPRIMHFSSQESFTKYDMCLIFADILKVPHEYIKPVKPTPGPATANRPRNSALAIIQTRNAGIPVQTVDFTSWWRAYLAIKKQ
ncbi:NAD-P-binding protein [Piptocephalis cylindrospora]|uniref:NAD-P-binding protein n=1 Tax=Piptocephalis cylindrospora TaxID=1907219 RepID=A0A4P9Y427_9FUNG|nr:NAD-P-binding protein [Piptocephalis cylindrospora]|eukprot:RKP12580.1 NAD-P-binding protein [Piptocephalis cylindrospora]